VQLINIEKSRYRRHLNRLIIGSIAFLLLSSLGISSLLILIMSQDGQDNFMLNISGVIVGSAIIISVVTLNKHHPWMREIYYVWRLKMELNFINRKLRFIEKAAAEHDITALVVLHFSYRASRQLWTLDDNTISIDTLTDKEQRLDSTIATLNLPVDSDKYQRTMLKSF